MPTKNSRVRGVRVLDQDYEKIIGRANRKGWTYNRWMNYAVQVALRSHKPKHRREE